MIKENEKSDTALTVIRSDVVTPEKLIVGDHLILNINNKDYYTVAIDQQDDGMLFIFEDCIAEMAMNKEGTAEGGYEKSLVRAYLRGLSDRIDPHIRDLMQPLENGDHFWLLSLKEVFGIDTHFEDTGGQLHWMKYAKSRIACFEGEVYLWWLRDVVSSAYFAYVYGTGAAADSAASNVFGVRPAFKIKNL